MDLEPNNSLAAAQTLDAAEIDGLRWAAGQVGTDADSDFYALTLSGDTMLKVRAYAAGSGAVQTVLRIYDSQGTLLTETDDAQAVFRVPSGGEGTYYVEVSALSGTAGDYVLSFEQRLLHVKAKPYKAQEPAKKHAPARFEHKGQSHQSAKSQKAEAKADGKRK